MKVVITGGTKGIGRAIAMAFAREGAQIAVCARNAADLQDLGRELEETCPGVDYIGYAVDCARKSELLGFCSRVKEKFSEIDVLVNNVGIYKEGGILEEPEGLLEEILAVNLYPAYHLSRFFASGMKARQTGYIFNICSVASIYPADAAGSYTISKHALLGLSRSLREELSPFHVRVTSVLPGSTLTASWEGTEMKPNCFVDPDDIALVVLNSFRMSKNSTVEEVLVTPTIRSV